MLAQCGFTPLYDGSDKNNYTVFITNASGDKLINSMIGSEINRLSKSDSKKIFKIKIITSYNKSIISKDAKGTASDYQLSATTNLVINKNGIAKNITFQEKQNIKNTSNIFELKNYEDTIKKNFAISIARKINLELLN